MSQCVSSEPLHLPPPHPRACPSVLAELTATKAHGAEEQSSEVAGLGGWRAAAQQEREPTIGGSQPSQSSGRPVLPHKAGSLWSLLVPDSLTPNAIPLIITEVSANQKQEKELLKMYPLDLPSCSRSRKQQD